jgi:hypothetical protein
MEYYEKMEEELCEFKKYLKMTMDLLVDAYKWLKLSDYADREEDRMKYKQVSDTLFNMFMVEHNAIGEKFKRDNN